jgi:hypothetical protein
MKKQKKRKRAERELKNITRKKHKEWNKKKERLRKKD